MWKLIVTVLIVLAMYSHCAKFGDDNSYTCHCINDVQCDKDNGLCSEGCDRGWYDASCQKQNVALGKPSSQVDTNGDKTSDLAVDGNRTTTVPDKCSDTSNDETIRWWRVDLLEEYPIKHITIYYQSEPKWALPSLKGFSLNIIKKNQEAELCYKDMPTKKKQSPVNNIECSQTITGRYVNISNLHFNRDARFLVLCEVEIYVCSVGTYGSDCTNFCHCLNNERCLETGKCPGRCADGWTGPTCSQKCTEGFYGDGCQKNCGNRKCQNDLSCDHVRGRCTDGCSDGYELTDCSKECDEGTYGQDCQFNCSARFCQPQGKDRCSNIDGACDCLEGYLGTDCTVTKSTFCSAECDAGCTDQSWIIIVTGILTLIIGLVAGALGVLFIMKRRLRSKANKSQTVTSTQSSNTVTQQETTINQPVTQPSSNNQDNAYSQLTTIYQNEHAYEHI